MGSNPLYSENYSKFIGVEAKDIRALLFDRKDGRSYWTNRIILGGIVLYFMFINWKEVLTKDMEVIMP